MSQVIGGGGGGNGTSASAYSPDGEHLWTVSTWPSGVTIDTTIQPFLDAEGRLTFFGWTGSYSTAVFVTITVFSSGLVGSAVALPQYACPTSLFGSSSPYIPPQPPSYSAAHTGPYVGGILGQIYFSDVAKVKGWDLPATSTILLGSALPANWGYAWGIKPGTPPSANTISWCARQRGWIGCTGGQIQWLERAPQITCWAPFTGLSNTKVWQLAETSEPAQMVVLYSALGAVNGNVIAYREQHHWTNQTYYGPVSSLDGGVTQVYNGGSNNPTATAAAVVAANQPTSIQRWVDSSSYSLIILDGATGALLASLPLTGFGPSVQCYRPPGVTMALCAPTDPDLTGFQATVSGEFDDPGSSAVISGNLSAVWSDGSRTGGQLNFFTGDGEVPGGTPGYGIGYYTSLHESVYEAEGGSAYIANSATINYASVKQVPRALVPFRLAPEPNLNLNEFASDGTIFYLLSGTLTDGVTGLPKQNQEQIIRVSAYSAANLTPVWSAPLPLVVGVGATATILALSAHLHLLVYDGNATTHFWLDRTTGAIVAPLEAVARTNPAGAYSATTGQLALAYGNTVRIYE